MSPLYERMFVFVKRTGKYIFGKRQNKYEKNREAPQKGSFPVIYVKNAEP
jgi:hypothetical protein